MFIKNVSPKNPKNQGNTSPLNDLMPNSRPTQLTGIVTVRWGEIVLGVILGFISGLAIGWWVASFIMSGGR